MLSTEYFECICNYYDFKTPINSKVCSICYRLTVISRVSFGEPRITGFGELGESYGVGRGSCANRKPAHDFRIPLNTKFFSICRRLTAIPISSFDPAGTDPPILPHLGGQGGPRGSKMSPIDIPSQHSYSTSIHTIGLSCTV